MSTRPSWTPRALSGSSPKPGARVPNGQRRSCTTRSRCGAAPPLADLAYEPFAQAEITRLEELRLRALEQRIDAELALGRHAEWSAELEALVGRASRCVSACAAS